MYIRRAYNSGVVRPKESYVPWPLCPLLRLTLVFMLSNINEVVGSVVQIFANHKGSFPREDNLCI